MQRQSLEEFTAHPITEEIQAQNQVSIQDILPELFLKYLHYK